MQLQPFINLEVENPYQVLTGGIQKIFGKATGQRILDLLNFMYGTTNYLVYCLAGYIHMYQRNHLRLTVI